MIVPRVGACGLWTDEEAIGVTHMLLYRHDDSLITSGLPIFTNYEEINSTDVGKYYYTNRNVALIPAIWSLY